MNIIEFIRDPGMINGDLSLWQETALRLLYGLPLTDEQRAIGQEALASISTVLGKTNACATEAIKRNV
jgi:hypothetical protein